MYKRIAALLLVILLTSCAGHQESEINQVVTAFHAAFDAKNIATLRTLCTKDMYWYTLNGKTLNASQIGDYFTPLFERWESIRTTLGTADIRCDGRLAVARYQGTVAILSSGKPSRMQGFYTTVLVKQEGSWKVWQHHMTSAY